jgi:hypothetical protein
MRVKMLALMLPFLLVFVSGCSTTEPRIEYVDRIVYTDPIIPETTDTANPSMHPDVWGDYKIYKEQCKAQIKACNIDKKSIVDSLKFEKN